MNLRNGNEGFIIIEIINSTACSSCLQLEEVLSRNGIPYHQINIKSLGPEEMAEIEHMATLKLCALRCNGEFSTIEAIMSTPMIRYYIRGHPHFLFPVDLMNHGHVRVEALAGIKAIAEGEE